MMMMVMIVSVPVAVCVLFQCDEYPYPRWLALHETECANPLHQREASAASVSPPRSPSAERQTEPGTSLISPLLTAAI